MLNSAGDINNVCGKNKSTCCVSTLATYKNLYFVVESQIYILKH